MKNVNELRNELFNSFNEMMIGYQNKNDSIYILVHTYTNKLLVEIASLKGESEFKSFDSIQEVINSNSYKEILNKEYLLNDFSNFLDIQKHRDQFRKSSTVRFNENIVSKSVNFLCELTIKFFEKSGDLRLHQIKSTINDKKVVDLNELESRTSNVVESHVEEKLSFTDSRITKLKQEILSLEKKKESLLSKKDIKGPNIKIDQIKALISQKNSEIEDLEDQIEISNDPSLQINLNQLLNQVESLEQTLIDLKNQSVESNDIELNRLGIVIKDKSNEISRLESKKSTIRSNKNLLATSTPIKVYNELMWSISVSFNSSYTGNSLFSIQGIDDEDHCRSKIGSVYAIIFNQLIKGDTIQPSRFLLEKELDLNLLEEIYKVEMSLLLLVRNGYLDDLKWNINLTNRPIVVLELAFDDLMHRVAQILTLTNITHDLPECSMNSGEPSNSFINISFDTVYPGIQHSISIQDTYNIEKLVKIWIAPRIKYNIKKDTNQIDILRELINEFFGFDDFREGQLDILLNVLNGNKTIGILTTGGGKSLVYQMAGLMQPKITLVVDPINALIHDQYRKMYDDFGIRRIFKIINDFQRNMTAKDVIQSFYLNPPLFAYSSPQRFQSREFRDLLISLNTNQSIGMICLDEVHCLSEWGHSFMIPYLMLTHTINTHCTDVQYLGLTATAAINVIKDLQVEMGIFDTKNIIFSKNLKRDNLRFIIDQSSNYGEMEQKLKQNLLEDYKDKSKTFRLNGVDSNAVLVFFKTVKELNTKYIEYSNVFKEEISKFHGSDKEHQDEFIQNKKTLLFATKSFGMGVDKPNIRKSIHFGMPGSREGFFQEAGRAGRDGNNSDCLLLTFKTDQMKSDLVELFLNLTTPSDKLFEIQKRFGYNTTDMSTSAFFMASDIDSIETEARNVISLYQSMCRSNLNMQFAMSITDNSSGKELHQTEKLLYILHKLGVVKNWEVKYTKFDSSGYDVTLNTSIHPNFQIFEHMKASVLSYLDQYSKNLQYTEKIDLLSSIDDMYTLVLIMREWYHNTFIRSRREQLANMVDFINRFKNGEYNTEIQNELSQFFDISRLIEKSNSSKSLRFESSDVANVISRASKVKQKELQEIRITMERLLETEENDNINLFTSLISLRSGMFNTRNGKDRLNYLFSKLTVERKREVYESLLPFYEICSDDQKIDLLEFLFNHSRELFNQNLFNGDYLDNHLAGIAILDINERYSDIV